MKRIGLLCVVLLGALGVGVVLHGCGKDEPPPIESVIGILTVHAVAISPDNKYMLVGYDLSDSASVGFPSFTIKAQGEKFLSLWDIGAGKEIRVFKGHKSRVTFVAFLPDGERVLSASLDGTMRLWEVSSGKQLGLFADKEIAGGICALSPNSAAAVSVGREDRLHLWDATSGKLIRRFQPEPDIVLSLTLSPSGKHVVSGGHPLRNKSVKIWDTDSGTVTCTLDANGSWSWGGAFSPDGKYLITERRREPWGPDLFRVDTVLWEVATGKEIRTFERYQADVIAACFTPDGKHILCAGEDVLLLWEVATGKEVWWELCSVRTIALSRDGKLAVTASKESGYPSFDLWDVPTGKKLRTLRYTQP